MHLIGCAVLFKITSPVKCTHTCTPRRLRLPRRAMVIYQNNCGVKCELEAHKKLLVLPVVSVSVRAAEWLMVLNVCNSVQADAGNYWSTCELAGWTMPSTFISASHQRISKDRVRMNEIINSLICKLTVNRFCKSHLLLGQSCRKHCPIHLCTLILYMPYTNRQQPELAFLIHTSSDHNLIKHSLG